MKHAGQVLCQHFNGSFFYCIQKANHSAQSLINIILEYFPSFRDIHEFKDRKGIYLHVFILILIILISLYFFIIFSLYTKTCSNSRCGHLVRSL